jgi:hypothetical protein
LVQNEILECTLEGLVTAFCIATITNR